MTDVTYYKGHIGAEDLNIGNSVFTRKDKDGAYRQLTQINKETFFVDWYKDVRDYTSFANAIDTIGTDDAILIITETCLVEQDVTVPKNIILYFLHEGAYLNISSGYAVTIYSPLNIRASYNQKIFSGTIVFTTKQGKIHVGWWGPSWAAVIDSSTLLQAAIDAGGDDSYIDFDQGHFLLTSGIHADYDDIILDMTGAQIDVSGTDNFVAVTLGHATLNKYRCKILRPKITFIDDLAWTSGGVGLRISNVWYGSVVDPDIYGFEKGIEYWASASKGCAQVNTYIHRVEDCKYPIYINPSAALAYVNENHFFGGELRWNSSVTLDASAAAGIYLYGGASTSKPNGNKFFGTSIENAIATAAYIPLAVYIDGIGNSFIECHFEGFSSRSDGYTVQLAAGATDNYFLQHDAHLNHIADFNVGSGATVHFQLRRAMRIMGGGDTDPMVTLREVNSANNKVLQIKNTSDVQKFSISGGGLLSDFIFNGATDLVTGTRLPNSDVTIGGGIGLYAYQASVDMTAGASVVIPVAVPTNCKIIGCQIRVDEEISHTWVAAYSGGSTQAIIATEQAVAKNTKVNKFFNVNAATDITSNTTNITITKFGAVDFTATGSMSAVIYFWAFTTLDSAA